MPLKRLITILLVLLSLNWLTACDSSTFTESTPIPPPPTTSSGVAVTVTDNTPIPTNLPDETAVEPTPTLIPTATPTATMAATAVTNPPVQVINSQPLPTTSRDLLFLADGLFKEWNHTTRKIEIVVPGPIITSPTLENPDEQGIGPVTSYSMSADGKRAVVARLRAVFTNSEIENSQPEYAYELLFVDMISHEIWLLVPQVDNLGDFQLSPDAQQLAFAATGLDGIPDATNSPPDADSGQSLPNNLYVLATGGGTPGPVRLAHDCDSRCFAPVWHGESNLVAFADDSALWLYNIAASEPEVLIGNQAFYSGMTDVGQVSIYSPIDWASNGRYLLLWHGRWEGGSRAVLDVPTNAFAPLPNSFVYADLFPTEISWMPDDRLLVWRTQLDGSEAVPQIELWRFDPGSEEIIVEETATLSNLPLGVSGGVYLADGRFAFALHTTPDPNSTAGSLQASGTYQLTSLAEIPERVNSLPPASAAYLQTIVLWSQDGSGALLVQEPRQFQTVIFYAPTDGDFLYEITAVFGQNAHTFQWQPEIIMP